MIDYGKIIGLLVSRGVEFIVVGGAAGTAHGSARFTADLDIVYSRGDENIKRLAEALTPLAPQFRGASGNLPFHLDSEAIKQGVNFTLSTSLGPIDLFGEITLGGSFEQLLPDCIELDVFGNKCLCLGLKRLIQVKRATARPKDLEAIAELQVILEEQGR